MQPSRTRDRIPELPSLTAGVNLLELDEQSTAPLQALILDHLLLNETTARWIDVFEHIQTQSLSRLAPSRQMLDRIQVARAFTPFQHFALVDDLADELLSSRDAPLVVAPALDGLYRSPDGNLSTQEASALLVRAVAKLAGIARRCTVPVVLTRVQDDEFSAPVARVADTVIEVTDTPHGPRFASDGFETLVYPVGNGMVQTTFAFWQRILEARQPLHAVSTDGCESAAGVTYGTN
ncbi:P-loop NTPase family protein [Natronococcus wangiae]|uniref:hypothetical protein n=1 Tax=Natronococcus wangiae TaxID=3068275 RepID=UPI00273F04E7|nr:hypothetical protein [Natronococcus sp. AD5]